MNVCTHLRLPVHTIPRLDHIYIYDVALCARIHLKHCAFFPLLSPAATGRTPGGQPPNALNSDFLRLLPLADAQPTQEHAYLLTTHAAHALRQQ